MHALKRLAPLAALLLLAGCQATTRTSGIETRIVDTSCAAFEPIRASRTDTQQTRDQVKAHNAAWDALCK
jgi:uncharacterized lipoprotein YajG